MPEEAHTCARRYSPCRSTPGPWPGSSTVDAGSRRQRGSAAASAGRPAAGAGARALAAAARDIPGVPGDLPVLVGRVLPRADELRLGCLCAPGDGRAVGEQLLRAV